MNPRTLFIATVVIALGSSVALAQAEPLTREQVTAEYQQAAADGSLRKTDYDFDRAAAAPAASGSRADVKAEMARSRSQPKLLGSAASRSYNPFGRELMQPSIATREQVRGEVMQARTDGTLPRTDYDFDGASRPIVRSARGG